MKTLFVTTLLLLATTAAQAERYRFVSSDNSDSSAMCIAATQSRAAFLDAAGTHGLDDSEFDTLYCNGLPMKRFISKYRERVEVSEPRYVFSTHDDSKLTQLCMAALSSKETYLQLKQQHFANDASVGEELKCNGLPVENFVRRYGNKDGDFTAAVQ